jgi:hypothetical protein
MLNKIHFEEQKRSIPDYDKKDYSKFMAKRFVPEYDKKVYSSLRQKGLYQNITFKKVYFRIDKKVDSNLGQKGLFQNMTFKVNFVQHQHYNLILIKLSSLGRSRWSVSGLTPSFS